MDKIDDYMSSTGFRGLAKSTQEGYRFALLTLKDFCKEAGVKKLDSDLEKHADAYAEFLLKRKISGKSRQQYFKVARILMSKYGYKIPGFTYHMTNTEKQSRKKKQVRRWFTKDEVLRCVRYDWPDYPEGLRARNHLMVRIMSDTGCRIRELLGIRKKDVDPFRGIIFINTSKTTARDVFISPGTQEAMQKYLTDNHFGPDNRIFNITARAARYAMGRMLDDLGLRRPGRMTHVFRHWVATNLFYNGGMNITDIAFLLGDKPRTIEKYYIHPTREMLSEKVWQANGWNERTEDDRDEKGIPLPDDSG